MKQIITVLALSILTLVLTSAYSSDAPFTEEHATKAVTATVFVKKPTFEVLHEAQHSTFTVIQKAKAPKQFEGTLLQLTSDSIDDLTMAATNLNIKKIIVFKEDADIAGKLTSLGFSVSLRE